MPKYLGLISVLVVCGLWSLPDPVQAQALLPYTIQLNRANLEKQGLRLAQEAAQLARFEQFELAIPRAKLAVQLAPKNDKVWFLLSQLHVQRKDFPEAIVSLTQAQKLNPNNPDILFALGSANFQQKKLSTFSKILPIRVKIKTK